MFVVECCVLSGRSLFDERTIRPEESYRQWCVVVCTLETSRIRMPWPVIGTAEGGVALLFVLFVDISRW